MEATVETKHLKEALSRLGRIAPSKSSNPVYTNVAIEPADGRLVMEATNGAQDLRVSVPADTAPAPRLLVNAALLARVVGAVNVKELHLEVQGPELAIEAGSFSSKLVLVEDADAFELDFGGEPLARMPASELAKLLSPVVYAASNEDYRAIFKGVQVELYPDRLRAVASDGFRLALNDRPVTAGISVELPQSAEEEDGKEGAAETEAHPRLVKLVLPREAIGELLHNLGEEGVVEIRRRPGFLSVVGENVSFATSLMEGEFPEYARAIPAEFPYNARVSAKELRAAVKRAMVMASDANQRVDLTFTEGKLELKSEGELGAGREVLEGVVFESEEDGAELFVAVNATYLLDAIEPVANDVLLDFTGPTTTFTAKDADDPQGYLAVLVPLRV